MYVIVAKEDRFNERFRNIPFIIIEFPELAIINLQRQKRFRSSSRLYLINVAL